MGVSVAWPMKDYSAEDVEAIKIAETVKWPRPRAPWTKKRPPFNARKEALRRHNCSVAVRLKDRSVLFCFYKLWLHYVEFMSEIHC